MTRLSFVLAAILSAATLSACGDPDEAACRPGQVGTCDCPGGGTGTQTCTDSGWGGCDCGSVGSDGDGDIDAEVDEDAGPDAEADAEPDAEPDAETPFEICDNGVDDDGDGAVDCDDADCECPPPSCGDGHVDPPEEVCDDGNTEDGDGCRGDCAGLEVCGDGLVDVGEACDQGEANSDTEPDACRESCALPSCGDGVVDAAEGCDDGNRVDGDGCRNDCTSPSCGDGVLDPGEECDDGNRTDGDGCQGSCRLPACGDSVLDPGEECDDGGRIDGDGCQADCTESECLTARDCDDGLFCDGAEACRAGVCVAGTAPTLDDGVACTDDRCDEGADRVTHTPNDGLCTALDRGPDCAATGRVEETLGRCDATSGCFGLVRVVDDCTDATLYPVTYSCGTGEIRRHDPICVPAAAGRAADCGYGDTLWEDCAGTIPSPHPYCSGSAAALDLNWHSNAEPLCLDRGPTCTYTEDLSACTAPGPSCTAGLLTTSTPTCSDARGCGVTAATTSCPDTPTACADNVLVTYTPACATRSTCGRPTVTRTSCDRAPTCEGNVYTYWGNSCDAAAETCVHTVLRAMDCDDREAPPTCAAAAPAVVTQICECDPTAGCPCRTETELCPTPDAECVARLTVLRTYTATCDRATATCGTSYTDEGCRGGCIVDPAGPDYCRPL